MTDWVVSIGTGRSQAPLILTARRRGFRVIGVDQKPNTSLVDVSIARSTYDTAGVADALECHTLRRHIRGILARTSGPAVATAAESAWRLGLPSCGRGLAAASVAKSHLREAGDAAGVPTIGGNLHDRIPDLPVGADWVIKPDQPVYGKRNVYRVRSDAELRKAFAAAAEESVNGRVEIQPFRPGRDIGLAVMAVDGTPHWHCLYEELVAEQDGGFQGLGVVGPAMEVPAGPLRSMLEGTCKLIALWNTTGFAFFSFRVSKSGPPLLYEVNPGLCGDGVAEQLFPALWPQSDFFELDVRVMTRDEFVVPLELAGGAAVLSGEVFVAADATEALALATRSRSGTHG